MSAMKFKISREKKLSWPNKCVCCGGNPIMRYPVVGKGYSGSRYSLVGDREYKSEKIVVEYPVCRQHFFWSLGIQTAYLVLVVPIALSSIMFVGALLFGFISIYWVVSLIFVAMLILSNLLQPLRVKRVRRNSYIMIIRNEEYAREFSMLNSINPIGGVFGDGEGSGQGTK